MPTGKMLMVSKVQDEFYYFFVRVKIISYLVRQENFDLDIYLDFKPKSR